MYLICYVELPIFIDIFHEHIDALVSHLNEFKNSVAVQILALAFTALHERPFYTFSFL
jgi:hypothetical protein